MTAEVVAAVAAGIRESRVLRFAYDGGGLRYRTLSPYEVRLPSGRHGPVPSDPGKLLLFGYDHEREAPRQFSIGKIEDAVLTDEPFIRPEEAV